MDVAALLTARQHVYLRPHGVATFVSQNHAASRCRQPPWGQEEEEKKKRNNNNDKRPREGNTAGNWLFPREYGVAINPGTTLRRPVALPGGYCQGKGPSIANFYRPLVSFNLNPPFFFPPPIKEIY
ncbi:hypothetical protein MOQ_000774, partial [Trypanosoma cruzi marinkellei]